MLVFHIIRIDQKMRVSLHISNTLQMHMKFTRETNEKELPFLDIFENYALLGSQQIYSIKTNFTLKPLFILSFTHETK